MSRTLVTDERTTFNEIDVQKSIFTSLSGFSKMQIDKINKMEEETTQNLFTSQR